MDNDNLDSMLQGDDQDPASQAQQDQGQNLGEDKNPPQDQTFEEAEFNKLSGTAQERFKAMARRTRQLAEQLEQRTTATIPPPSPVSQIAPDVQVAVSRLSEVGIATDDKVDQKLNQRFESLQKDLRARSLESKYSGQKDAPQFVQDEVEDYVRQHPQYKNYDLEDVFKYKMFPDEFMSLEVQNRQGQRTGRTGTLRSTRTAVQQDSLTPEYIDQRLKQPDGVQWYEANMDKINQVLGRQE